ncbi:hypothetical protein FB451DRAFT_1169165 [Mycena latifolia]|nr:hypothetical protein FB451DRAFT_1169165 [Mycena latifolia]
MWLMVPTVECRGFIPAHSQSLYSRHQTKVSTEFEQGVKSIKRHDSHEMSAVARIKMSVVTQDENEALMSAVAQMKIMMSVVTQDEDEALVRRRCNQISAIARMNIMMSVVTQDEDEALVRRRCNQISAIARMKMSVVTQDEDEALMRRRCTRWAPSRAEIRDLSS